jgi:hypothetical protein
MPTTNLSSNHTKRIRYWTTFEEAGKNSEKWISAFAGMTICVEQFINRKLYKVLHFPRKRPLVWLFVAQAMPYGKETVP